MRIDTLSRVNQLYQAGRPKKSAEAKTEDRKDFLEISQSGKDYQVAKAAVQDAPDIREERVEAIRQEMAAGTYSVGGKEIAERLVERYFDQKI